MSKLTQSVMLLVGGGGGVLLRLLLLGRADAGSTQPALSPFVVTGAGALVIGFLTGLAGANAPRNEYAAFASIALSAALLTFCVFSSATIHRMRGRRDETAPALRHGALGFTAATVGVIVGALAVS